MFCRKLRTFKVTVHLDGRHPYLEGRELDYKTRDIVLTVPAKNWNDAEKKALNVHMPKCWAYWVTAIESVRP